MQTLKIILKKIAKMPKVHIGGIIIALIVVYTLISFLFGRIDFAFFKNTFIKAIILLGIIYGIYFANVFVYSQIDEEDEEKPKSTFIPNPGPPAPKPDHYGTNIKVKVVTTVEDKKAEEIREAIEKFNLNKAKSMENKPTPTFNQPKPTPAPKPIVEEGKSKAEQAGNTVLNEEGKPIVKPNYKMIASEWVKNNLELLNKICNDAYAISGGSSEYSATIPATFLPAEKASWIVIGKTLVAEDDISSFKILKEGLEITVS